MDEPQVGAKADAEQVSRRHPQGSLIAVSGTLADGQFVGSIKACLLARK